MQARSLVWFGILLCAGVVTAAERPFNLLIITADDMNADSSGWMGSKLGATPHLDAFAASAHRFVNAHVTVPICQPGRSALMTGRVPHRNGALGFNPIRSDVPTIVELLRDRGWYTAAINKVEHMQPDEKFPWDTKFNGSGKNPPQFRTQCEQCFQAAAEAKKPFFVNANITDPHRPFPASEQGEQKQGKKAQKRAEESGVNPFTPEQVVVPGFLEDIPLIRREVAQYFTGVRRFDRSFGELMAALQASGEGERTIVVFLSDHGMSFPFSKATVYRNGTWSPVLIRWPGMGEPQRRDEFVSSVDILPTILELLRVAPPQGLDGRSWLPLLKGEKQPARDYVVTHVNTVSSGKSFPQRCIRTKDFSLMFHAWPNGQPHFRVEAMSGLSFNALAAAAKDDQRIAGRVEQLLVGVPLAFYDLRTDPDERRNLIDAPQHREEIDRLAGLLRSHMEQTSDPQLGVFREALARRQ